VNDAVWRKYTDGQRLKIEVRASSGDVVCSSLWRDGCAAPRSGGRFGHLTEDELSEQRDGERVLAMSILADQARGSELREHLVHVAAVEPLRQLLL